MKDTEFALGGQIYWADLCKEFAIVWWECSKIGAILQHGDLESPKTQFSIVLPSAYADGGRCFHGATPLDAWNKAHDWLISPDRGQNSSLAEL